MECDVCGDLGINKNPIFPCDSCNKKICKQCANLTSSEVRVLELKDSRILKFHCSSCEKLEHHILLQQTIQDKSSIIEAKEEIISLLRKKIAELENSRVESETPTLYSQVIQNNTNVPKTSTNIPSIIIKPKQHQNFKKTETDIKKNIKPTDLKISIKNTRGLKNGGMIIKCPNKNDIDILKKEAEHKLKEYEIQVTKMRLPRFKIVGYNSDLDEQQIAKAIREQNDLIKESDKLTITFIKKPKNSHATAVVFGECSPNLFQRLMQAKKIYIDWQRYPVYEDIGVIRCFKCQQYYHRMETCQNEVVCDYCSGDHHIKNCPKTQKKCVNCVTVNYKYKLNYTVNHEASDLNCPSYQYLLNILRGKIDYDIRNG